MNTPFIHPNFLLDTKAARRLYHEYAASEPIIDYHGHLPPQNIAENRRFNNLWEIWLEGDHYKWRAMRANGVAESFCTGQADPFEKFLAWARTTPHTLRNPLYHWTHLELKRYFDIDELLDEHSARRIWDRANERLATPDRSVHGILREFRVRVVCTTDDPADDLAHHQAIAASGLPTRVYPTFRPDKALLVHQPQAFNAWLGRLETVSNRTIQSFSSMVETLRERHDYFHQLGCRLSDHGLDHAFADLCTDAEAQAIFQRARQGHAATPAEQAGFAAQLMLHFGRWNAAKGWTLQLHLGALRNNNTRRLRQAGPDTGFDSIGDWPQARELSAYLDRLDLENALPKVILYNLNPRDNYVFAAMPGNFQDGVIPGKIQWGSGWWFLDQKEGMKWQLNALSNLGLLSRFVGMVTDSRSFMSFPRHEYFRRVLCQLIGRDLEAGELPDDDELIGPLIRRICYGNAKEYLGLEIMD
jgi:glucuronate isomerase